MKEKHENEMATGTVNESISEMISLFIDKGEDREWAYEEIVNGGPPHKQVLSALLLSKTLELIRTTEEKTGEKFAALPGTEILNHKYEEEYVMPVEVVLDENVQDKEEVAEFISKAPDHESLVYMMVMQAIDWAAQKN